MRVKSVALVDIETSGINHKNSEIIYVHATILPAASRLRVYSEYAKPTRPLRESEESLIGITNDMLDEKRPSDIVKAEFVEQIKDCIVIGTNKAYLEDSLGIEFEDFIDAREIMKIELVSNHDEELKRLADDIGGDTISTADVQKRLKVPYPEASMIADILNAIKNDSIIDKELLNKDVSY